MHKFAGLLFVAVFIVSPRAFAEDITGVDFSVQLRTRYESLQNFNIIEESTDADNIIGQRIIAGVEAEPKDTVRAKLSILGGYYWGDKIASGAPTDIPATHSAIIPAAVGLDLHEAFFELRDLAGVPFVLRTGRQQIELGSGRLIGVNDWALNPNSFDAILLRFYVDLYDFDFYYARLPEGRDMGMFNFHIGADDTAGVLSDIYLIYRRTPGPEGIGLAEQLFNAGANLNISIIDEALNFDLEFDYQFGTENVNLPGEQDIAAYAGFASLDYKVLAGSLNPFFGAALSYASGEDSAGVHRSFDCLYPSTGSYFGQAAVLGFSNSAAARGRVGLETFERISLYLDYYYLALAETLDYWNIDGGNRYDDAYLSSQAIFTPAAAEYSDADRTIGHELDVVFEMDANRYFNFAAAYSHLFVGDYASDILKKYHGFKAADIDYFYIQGTVQF